MRRQEQEITDPLEIEETIKKAEVCRLGLVDGESPYVVPLNFGYQPGTFFIHGAKAGRKIDALKTNSQVCIEIDLPENLEPDPAGKACEYGYGYRSIIAEGSARFLDDPEEKKKALGVIVRKYAPEASCEFPEASLKGTAVIAIDVKSLTAKRSS